MSATLMLLPLLANRPSVTGSKASRSHLLFIHHARWPSIRDCNDLFTDPPSAIRRLLFLRSSLRSLHSPNASPEPVAYPPQTQN